MNTAYYTEKSRRFAIYPDAGTGNTTEYMYLALGLSDEAGEVAGKINKMYRDGAFDPEGIAKELGDVMWYLTMLADTLGYTLDDILKLNLQKLEGREERGTLGGSGDNR